MIQAATLLPIAPLLLLPFILIFFIVVFPFWLVGVSVLWVVRQIVRLIAGRESRIAARVQIWFRWVLTFGGFTETYVAKGRTGSAPPPSVSSRNQG